jgi:hypothetical protein
MLEKIDQFLNLLEEITGKECDLQISNGKVLITITENKRGCIIPDDLKLLDMDEFDSYISTLPENTDDIC